MSNEQQTEQQDIQLEQVKTFVEIENEKVGVELFQSANATRYGFTQLQNTYLNNSLRFADTKAGALVAVNGLIIKFVADFLTKWNGIVHGLATVSIGLLVISILLSVIVVLPKNIKDNEKGFIYWRYIVNDTLENYKDQIKNRPTSELLDESIRNNYLQAIVLAKKFRWLHMAFVISLIAYVVMVLLGITLIIEKYR